MWLSAGAGAMWSDACRKALIACGINPDSFGTYKDRADAQSAERAKYQAERCKELGGTHKKHPAPCKYSGTSSTSPCSCYQTAEALKHMDGDRWIKLNSQSGHLSRNAFYQGEGARADPCSNVRPSAGNSGGYGYRDDAAFCMDHAGLRTGMEHYEICRREQRQGEHVGDGPMPISPKVPPDGTSLREGVEGTARIAAEGTASRRGGDERYETFDPKDKLGKMSEKREERGELGDAAREKAAQELKEKEAQKAGKVDSKGKAQAKAPNSASGAGPSQKTMDEAVKCIADAWEASLKEMQTSAITEYGTAAKVQKEHVDKYNSKKPPPKPPAESVDDLPKKEKAAANEAAKKAVDEKQKELEKKKAESAGRAGDPPPKEPTKEQCLEYQANWLDQHRDASGNCPPMQGSGGAGPPPQTTPKGKTPSGRTKL